MRPTMLSNILSGFALISAATVSVYSVAKAEVLINANIAGEYVVTSMPLKKSPGCPLVGGIQFFPGGTLIGTFVTDMARSKSMAFKGRYSLKNGKDITFSSDTSEVPLSNINGVIEKTVITNPKRPPVAQLVITTSTSQCPGEKYKLTVYVDEE